MIDATERPLSPFALLGPRLVDMGYSVIPILPHDKSPGSVKGGRWVNMMHWSQYCSRLPTAFELRAWCKWPDANIGMCAGAASGWTIPVDLDHGGPEVRAAIESCLPYSPVKKMGLNGYTAFFHGSSAIKSRKFSLFDKDAGHKVSVCEILSDGRQTVLPPSRHPSGNFYRWITPDTLEDTPPEKLPVLDDDIVAQITRKLEQFGYEPEVERPAPRAFAEGQDGSIWQDVNRHALANLDAWVPDLGLFKLQPVNGRYSTVAHWRPSNRGRPLHERSSNLSISPGGIKDFGDDKGYSPLDLVMAASEIDLDRAYAWLAPRVMPDRATIHLGASQTDPTATDRGAAAPRAVIEANDGALVDGETGEVIETDSPEDDTLDLSLTRVPGLLGEITDWMTSATDEPTPVLNLAASLAILGALFGRRFETVKGTCTNLYVVALAGSSIGKSHPMKCGKSLFEASGLLHFLGGSKIKSGAGLRSRIETAGSVCYFLDEFGGHIRPWLTSNAMRAHAAEIRDLVMALYSEASSFNSGDDLGAGATEIIIRPNLVLYGTTTPHDLWRSLDSASGIEGFLPRFVLFDAGERRAELGEGEDVDTTPPQDIVDAARAASGYVPRTGNMANLKPKYGLEQVAPTRVPFTADAKEAWMASRRKIREDSDADPDHVPFYGRIAEHATKLAMIRALGCDWTAPLIGLDDYEWGLAVARHSIATMIRRVGDHIADNPQQADYLWVRRLIRGRRKGMTMREIQRSLSGRIAAPRLRDIVGQMREAGDVETVEIKGKTGPLKVAYMAAKRDAKPVR